MNYNKINDQKTSIKVSSYIVKQPLTVDDSLNIYRYNRTLIKHRLHKSQLSNNTQYMIIIKESIHYNYNYMYIHNNLYEQLNYNVRYSLLLY